MLYSLTDSKIAVFLKNGTVGRTTTDMDRHVLTNWKLTTLTGYICAVKKYLAFAAANNLAMSKLRP